MKTLSSCFAHPLYAPAQDVAARLAAYDDILITAHVTPDGDAVGSMYALAFALQALGKRVALCNSSGIPDYLSWLTAPGTVYQDLDTVPFVPQLAVILDCGGMQRVGEALANSIENIPSINIDHHIHTPPFASIANWVEPRAAATAQMVAALISALSVPLQGDIAASVYVAISSDSGGFSFDNVTPELLLLAALLLESGFDAPHVRQQMANQWSEARMRLWGALLQKFTLHHNNQIALCTVSLAELAVFGVQRDALEGIAEQLRRLKSAKVSILVREDAPKQCKISLRSAGALDVQIMAKHFGGGGHRNAAGATVYMTLADTTEAVLDIVCEHLG